MAKDFSNNPTAAYLSGNKTTTTTESTNDKRELEKLLKGKTQAEINELLKEYKPESRSRHIQILATPSLYDRIKERITAENISMNTAFERVMTAWLEDTLDL